MILLLLACGAGADFAAAQADALCAWHARCDTLEAAGFDDEAQCQERLADAVTARSEHGELGCEGYDASAVEACLAVYTDTPCEDVPDLTICESVCP